MATYGREIQVYFMQESGACIYSMNAFLLHKNMFTTCGLNSISFVTKKMKKMLVLPVGESNPGHGGESAGS